MSTDRAISTPALESGGPAGLPAWKQARRQAIIAAAKKALRRQRYEQIQIRDVASAAGVALATLYRYFPSKEELYVAVLIEATTPPSSLVPDAPNSAADLVRSRVHLVLAAYEKDPSPFPLGVSLHGSEDPAVHQKLNEWGRHLSGWLMEGVESRGEIAVGDLAALLWPIVRAGLSEAIMNGGTFEEARRIADEFIEMIADQLIVAED